MKFNYKNAIFSAVILLFSFRLLAAPANFAYQGQILKPSGQALEGSNVTFVIEVISPGSEECVLYEEFHTLNMTGSNGVFSLEVGSGSRSGSDYEDINSLSTALDNSTGSVSPTYCVIGSTYTPAATDGRKLRLTFDDGTGPVTLAQDHNLVSVPFSHAASTLDGKGVTDFINVNTNGALVLTQTNLENVFTSTNYTELMALLGGTSSQYLVASPSSSVDANSQKIINVATPTVSGDAANKGYVDGNIGGSTADSATLSVLGAGDAGEVLTWDGGKWVSTAPIGDSTKLPLDGSAPMTGALEVPFGSVSNPSITFDGDEDTGFYHVTTNQIGFATAGAKKFEINGNGLEGLGTGSAFIRSATGTSAAPAYTFTADADTGIYRPAEDEIAFTIGGTEALRLDPSGHLAIGTTVAVSPLTVDGGEITVGSTDARDGSHTSLALSGPSGNHSGIEFNAGRGAADFRTAYLSFFNNNVNIAQIETRTGSTTSAGAIALSVNNGTLNEAMRIDEDGNIGIGTTIPSEKLDVIGTTATTGLSVNGGNVAGNTILASSLGRVSHSWNGGSSTMTLTNDNTSNNSVAPLLALDRSRFGVTSDIQADFGGEIRFNLEGATNGSTANAGLLTWAWENAQTNDTTDRDAYLSFSTAEDDTLAERMRINSSGNVGIGTTNPGYPLHVYTATGGVDIQADTDASGSDAEVSVRAGSRQGGMTMYGSTHATKSNIFEIGTKSTGGLGEVAILTGDQSERVRIDESGNVGIGTTNPTAILQVDTVGARVFAYQYSLDVTAQSSGGGWARGFRARNGGGAGGQDGAVFGAYGNATTPNYAYMAIPTSDAIGYDSTKILVLDNSGNIGIGTTAPASRLHVDGAGAGGGLCVTSDGTCSAVPAGGEISAETTLNTGADYAEYFNAEEKMKAGDVVGLNPRTGLARAFREGDHLIGIVSTAPGVIGNSELAASDNSVLVALTGQVPFNKKQTRIDNGRVLTQSGQALGFLLATGHVYINLASGDGASLNREIAGLKLKNQELADKLSIKSKEMNRLKQRLESIEQLLQKSTSPNN